MGRRAFAMEAEAMDSARDRNNVLRGPVLVERISVSNGDFANSGEAGQVIDLFA
jgi:hypothetical protein